MKQQANNIKILFLTGCILISTIAVVLVVASLCFMVNITIASWQFPVSFVLTGILYFYLAKDYYGTVSIFLKSFLFCFGIILLSILIALCFYDLSYDGQTYHMETIVLLKNGWNPFKTLLPQKNYLYLYINHYPRAVELPQSTIYSLIGRIEATKSINFVLLTATFCLCLSYLLGLNKLSNLKCILLSFVATFNPVAVNQLISTYVDGQMALLFLSFFIASLYVLKKSSSTNLILLGSIIVITANIKFTSLVYICIFAFAFAVWILFTRNKQLIRRTFLGLGLSGFISIFIVGFHPYVINTVDFKHPFYPLMGSKKMDIITVNIPKGLQHKNAAGKFFTSLFAHTDNLMNDNERDVELKIPFTFNKIDIVSAPKIDARVAGFGPMFSGILLLSVVLFIVSFFFPGDTRVLRGFSYFIFVIAFSVFIMPDSWWARYVPQLWFLPVGILLGFELYSRTGKAGILKFMIYAALTINIGFTFIGFGWNFIMSRLVDYQLEKLKASRQPVEVQWDICSTNYVRFQENGIKFIEKDLKDRKDVELIVRSNSLFVVDPNVDIPKSNFIKWAEKYQQPAAKQ